MSTGISGKQVLLANYGNTVVRAAAAVPSNGSGAIFNVVNGRVLITNLFGEVTTVFSSAGATFITNTIGTASGITTAVGTASASQTATAVGALYSFPSYGGQSVFGASAPGSPRFIVKPGTISITTSAAITGAMSWYCNYISLDGGYITAA